MLIIEPTDLIIVNTDRTNERGGLGDTLYRIETQHLSLDMGAPSILKMRMVDQNLN
jgi:hypothetical protein